VTRRIPLLLVALLLTGAAASSEAPPPETPGTPAAETAMAEAAAEPKGRSWFALPMLFWLPETKLGVAGSAGLHFRVPGSAPRSSSAFLVLGYTLEGQGSVDLSSDVQLASGTLLSGRFRAVHYPDSFYGIGPSTGLDEREEMTRRFLELTLTAELPIFARLRAGPRVHARAEEIKDAEPGGRIAAGDVTGADGFTAVGFGLNLTWDSRDRPLWPSSGTYAQATYAYYPSSIGRNEGFGRASLEGRLFLPLGRERILGVAAMLEEAHGETPFTILSKLGSTRYLRGIREGRHRDAVAWAAQLEVRLPLAERLYGALFGAFGDVGPDLGALRAATLKVAGGAGLRFKLTDAGANLRLDLAGSDTGPEVYVLLLEAF
jgi:hypothetical protein